MTKEESTKLIDEVFDKNLHDTRYRAGTVSLYSAILAKKYGKRADYFEAAADKFVGETSQWHEKRRWNFEPHPDFEQKILGK